MNLSHPEPLLTRVLHINEALIDPGAAKEAQHFIEHGECGLGYDVLVFEIEEGRYMPTPEALELIKQAAVSMNLIFPGLSTG
ncbi:MAG TPA: hypothetical protein VLG41_09105 [Hydrogenophaga sp.]|uniref:hypothetical protein n=1 Tax=Hydrogenophaga sp. TaxID=1904254 RepID=UPI002C440833|nr:hypothetical protein [Hydrogenophaga sp.]HSX93065.1 hypothetical protein [Hydrogenophaga sp.]